MLQTAPLRCSVNKRTVPDEKRTRGGELLTASYKNIPHVKKRTRTHLKLLSSKTAAKELSTWLILLVELLSRAKMSFVQMQFIVTQYDSTLFRGFFLASDRITFSEEDAAPPVQEKTSGQNCFYSKLTIFV